MRLNRFALIEIRERSGYRKSELARLAGISPAHMTDIELGRRHPSGPLICRFATALKVPVAAILAEVPNGGEEVA